MRNKIVFFLGILGILSFGKEVFADVQKDYDPDDAVDYALNNYDRVYGSGASQNNFNDYSWVPEGGNCTNFVSQCIMGGLVGSDDSPTVYDERDNYDIDVGSGTYEWYFHSDGDHGTAFTGANFLYPYAVNNLPTYKGLHFEYVTHDTLQGYMDYWEVEEGDVIFADLNHDGTINHSMLVTDFDIWDEGYDKIRLTYQGSPGVIGKTDIGLGWFNDYYQYQAVFYVYRPIDYNPEGY